MLYKISKLDNPLCKNLQNIDRNKPVNVGVILRKQPLKILTDA